VSRKGPAKLTPKAKRGKVELRSLERKKGLASPLLKSINSLSLKQAFCHGTSGILF